MSDGVEHDPCVCDQAVCWGYSQALSYLQDRTLNTSQNFILKIVTLLILLCIE